MPGFVAGRGEPAEKGGRERIIITIIWKGRVGGGATHTKKSLFSGEKSEIATRALEVARFVIRIVTLPPLPASSSSVPKKRARWERGSYVLLVCLPFLAVVLSLNFCA